MKFETWLPCTALQPYVKYFIVSESSEAKTYKVLPDTSLVMGFQYTGQLAYVNHNSDTLLATAGITGLTDSYRLFKNTACTNSILVVFKETGAAAFLKSPIHELFGESLSLDHFFNTDTLTETEDKLCAAINDRQRITIIEQLLLQHLHQPFTDKLVSKAIDHITQSKGTIRITELARQLNISQSPLEKRFRKVVGASPKKFASIVRIKNVRSLLNIHNYQQAVYLSGYYDQANFIKDFKTFTGHTPEEYLKLLIKP